MVEGQEVLPKRKTTNEKRENVKVRKKKGNRYKMYWNTY
jgi:hypothetical protein